MHFSRFLHLILLSAWAAFLCVLFVFNTAWVLQQLRYSERDRVTILLREQHRFWWNLLRGRTGTLSVNAYLSCNAGGTGDAAEQDAPPGSRQSLLASQNTYAISQARFLSFCGLFRVDHRGTAEQERFAFLLRASLPLEVGGLMPLSRPGLARTFPRRGCS